MGRFSPSSGQWEVGSGQWPMASVGNCVFRGFAPLQWVATVGTVGSRSGRRREWEKKGVGEEGSGSGEPEWGAEVGAVGAVGSRSGNLTIFQPDNFTSLHDVG